jgi:5'-AMP-activated protein kinase catalytic alpha subunit
MNIKIVDFGLSNTFKTGELLKTACGSPCYAAPEMIAGKKYEGLKADLWSCGVILFAMVCGYLPFEDSNTNTLYKKILACDYQFPKFISNDAKDIIKGILNVDPDQRLCIDQIRKHNWFSLIKEEIQPGILIGYDHIIVDMDILKQLEKYGYNLDYTRKCLEANKHNDVTTAYYLLLKKHIQDGGVSIADYGYRPEIIPMVQSQTPQENCSQIIPPKKKLLKTNRRAGSMSNTYKDGDLSFKINSESRPGRNTSQKVPKHRRITDSPPSRNKKEIFSGFRLLFKKASTPRPPSLQRPNLKNRGKTPGMRDLELAPIARNSPKIYHDAKIRF